MVRIIYVCDLLIIIDFSDNNRFNLNILCLAAISPKISH